MNKYRNKPVTIDGIRFASQREGKRYVELKILERAGEIQCLTLQRPYKLEVNGLHVCKYVADFVYVGSSGEIVVEDVKGVRTKEYIIKRALMKACLGIDVKEV